MGGGCLRCPSLFDGGWGSPSLGPATQALLSCDISWVTQRRLYSGHVGSTAASLAILGLMVAVLVVSLVFSRWPHLPVDPRTLAGSIYYVSRSGRLREDLCGRRLALEGEKSCAAEVEGLNRWYGYGPLGRQEKGDNLKTRMAVEVEEDHWYPSFNNVI